MIYLRTVKGYELGEAIGEGSCGKVKIGRNPVTSELVAIKIVPKTSDPEERQRLHKEIVIHKSLMHENVVRMYGSDEDQHFNYIVMELAGGGELFDKIAPDYGVGEDLAHFYFTQLIAGVKYLHSKGIAHRDLKPENLLLDDNGNLKISDFGFSTVFKHKGVIRPLTTPCGSPPYVAPEIHSMKYSGTAVDIWSTGVILYTLFVGNTPWEEPTTYSPEFVAYVSNPLLNFDPWNRIPTNVLSLLTGILNVNPALRFTMKDIEMHSWFRRPNPILSKDGKCVDPIGLATRLMDKLTVAGEMDILSPTALISFSQPQYMTKPAAFDPQELTHSAYAFSQPAPQHHVMSFSQPTQVFTQTFTQQRSTGGFSHVLPSEKLTRFYSLMPIKDMLEKIAAVLELLVVPHATHRGAQKITLSTVDRRKCPLYGDIRIQRTGDALQLVLFRRSKGDPLEWRRLFKAVTSELEDVVFMG